MDFKTLKKRSKGKLSQLTAEIEKMNTSASNNNDDDRFWKLTVDKAGNGHAIIRFLPAPEGEDFPWVRMWDHGFQGPGGSWYIENSLTTLGKQDPCSEYNSMLWNSGLESDKDIARNQKRRLSHYSNILVVDDPANPENNGKVFLYKYGQKIFEKAKDKMNPEFEDETAINPFDFLEGANFKLRAAKRAGFRNYDKSEFAESTPVTESDEEIGRIWGGMHSLQDLISPDKFKTYAELQTRLNSVLGLEGNTNESIDDSPTPQLPSKEAPSLPTAEAGSGVIADSSDDDDDGLDYFKKLADES